jgi:hypothetical protein
MFSKKLWIFLGSIIIGAVIGYASNVIISPNMSLPIPVVGQDPGPDWANNINASLTIIDGHNHTPGSGVQVPPAGLNINSDLTFQGNNATNLRSDRFAPQSAPLSGAADLGAIYESGVDLWYNDGAGNQIRLTQGGAPVGSPGTITGLPSGTASASYSAGTFTFESATNTPAAINGGPLTIANQTASAYGITIAPNSGIAANYDIFLPPALPSGLNYVTLDSSGNLSYNSAGYTGSGNVVLVTSPQINSPTINAPTITGSILGNQTFPGTTTFNGPVSINDGGGISGGFAGDPNFAGNPTFGGDPIFNGSTTFAGDAIFTQPVTISATGGNVPHTCTVRSITQSGDDTTVSCNAGEMATGGGCSFVGSPSSYAGGMPVAGTPPTQWECRYFGATNVTASAVCCQY